MLDCTSRDGVHSHHVVAVAAAAFACVSAVAVWVPILCRG